MSLALDASDEHGVSRMMQAQRRVSMFSIPTSSITARRTLWEAGISRPWSIATTYLLAYIVLLN